MSIDYKKLTVQEIQQMLIDEGRFNKEELKGLVDGGVKGKAMWVNLHRNHTPVDEVTWEDVEDDIERSIMDGVDALQLEVPEKLHASEERQSAPRYDSPEWNEYVMGLFAPEELIDGKYPNVNSLRRLTELLLGDIVFSGPVKVEQTMELEHTGKAVVTYQVTIDWKLDAVYAGYVDIQEGYPQRTFTSVASSWIGNTDDMYAVFPESIAETRAEGRALRRALRLNVVCADELTKKDTAAIVQQQKTPTTTTGEWDEEGLITDAQINTIKLICDRLNIDLNKFINSGSKKYNNIEEVKKSAAAGMLKQLSRYQSAGSDALDIPNNLIGD
jgi:hypothetical protein